MEPTSSSNGWVVRLVTVVAAVLILGIVQILAKVSWQLGPAVSPMEAPVREQPGLQTAKGKGPGIVEQLELAAPFGRADRRSKPAPVRVVVPETRLDLELKGVIAGTDGKSGGAIIADKKDGDRYFSIGESLPGGVILDEVHPQRVVLLRNERQEVLKLIQPTLEPSSEGGKTGMEGVAGGGLGRARPTSPRSTAPSGYRKATQPGGMNRAIRIRPLFRGGKIKGFRISPGRDRKQFIKLGFKAGDLLVRINGKTPQTPKEIFSMLDELQKSGGATVEVTRRGRPVSITLGAP